MLEAITNALLSFLLNHFPKILTDLEKSPKIFENVVKNVQKLMRVKNKIRKNIQNCL